MQIVWEDGLLDPFCKCRGIVAGVRTYAVADAGAYVSGPGSRIACARVRLIYVQSFNDGLQHFVDFGHICIVNAGNLESLAVGNEMCIRDSRVYYVDKSGKMCYTDSSGALK